MNKYSITSSRNNGFHRYSTDTHFKVFVCISEFINTRPISTIVIRNIKIIPNGPTGYGHTYIPSVSRRCIFPRLVGGIPLSQKPCCCLSSLICTLNYERRLSPKTTAVIKLD